MHSNYFLWNGVSKSTNLMRRGAEPMYNSMWQRSAPLECERMQDVDAVCRPHPGTSVTEFAVGWRDLTKNGKVFGPVACPVLSQQQCKNNRQEANGNRRNNISPSYSPTVKKSTFFVVPEKLFIQKTLKICCFSFFSPFFFAFFVCLSVFLFFSSSYKNVWGVLLQLLPGLSWSVASFCGCARAGAIMSLFSSSCLVYYILQSIGILTK